MFQERKRQGIFFPYKFKTNFINLKKNSIIITVHLSKNQLALLIFFFIYVYPE